MAKWKRPVEITVDGAGRQTIHGPYAAAMSLMIGWPTQGPERDKAQQICLDAAQSRSPSENARDAFLSAVEEAGLTIVSEEKTPFAA
ncbi:DUF982 domain-containing protein [Mycoplana sp. MJR14]|uniref:DUF982 domain-containing protein n=1 Tax=Mycoplana sp. MJR14 TaxID=3032583 RepID=UPI0023D9F61E|nr:DUF982 domain-containing protein [Mycoplana sp. MJR14]MDF1631236.1 DUF982 domain-containing protein [Mycoplana sp. MJR14]